MAAITIRRLSKRYRDAALAGELRNTADRLDALDGGEAGANLSDVFACSYRALDEQTARLFASLGLSRAPDLSTRSVADLAGLPPARARVLLRQLETVNLVTQHLPGRYRMHDLVRLYARDLALRFNHRFGPTFAVPRPYILAEVAKITDLDNPNAKMGKSTSSPQGIIDVLEEPASMLL